MLLLSINAPVEASQSNTAFGSVVPQSAGALRCPSRHLINLRVEKLFLVQMCCQHVCTLPLPLPGSAPAFKHPWLRGAEREGCAPLLLSGSLKAGLRDTAYGYFKIK